MPQDLEYILDRIVDIDLAANQLGLSGKIPHVFDNAGGTLHIGDNIIGHGSQVFVVNWGAPF